jgi:DNA-directed RNA polymerase subunit RPC12/RpoP
MFETYYCPRCQTQVTKSTTLCPKCGARLSGVQQVERCIRCGKMTPINTLRGGRCPSCAGSYKYGASSKRIASKIVLFVLILFTFVGAVVFWYPRLETVNQRLLYSGITTLVIGVLLYFLFRLNITLTILGVLSYALSAVLAVISLLLLLQGIPFVQSLLDRLPEYFTQMQWWLPLIFAGVLALAGFGLIHDAKE